MGDEAEDGRLGCGVGGVCSGQAFVAMLVVDLPAA